ncbi:MAG: PhnD/SsuA/transferrin family substrate-binding protein [Deferrisomatales bacterium]
MKRKRGVGLALFAAVMGWWAAALAEPAPVRFTVIPRYNPLLMVQSYQPLVDYLNEATPYRFELTLTRSYEETVEALRDGRAQFASLGDVTFARAFRTFGAVPLVRPLNADGAPFYRSIIVVRRDSPVRSVQDLKGRSFAFGDIHSTSGNLIPRLFLFRHGVRLSDLSAYRNLGGHDAVAKAVLKGQVDAGAVKDVMARRYRAHGLRFLAESDPIPSVPIVCRADTPAPLREAVARALLALDPADPSTRRRLAQWDPELRHGFVRARVEDYEPIFRELDAIPRTCGEGCHR